VGTARRVMILALALFALCAVVGVQFLWAAPGPIVHLPGNASFGEKLPIKEPDVIGVDRGLGPGAPSAPNAPLVTQVLCVGSGATGSPCTNATPFANIQSAVNASVTGDEVRIASGTYTNTGASVVTFK